ncbi:efflux RND transporter periplasmic adaptor subunit [Sediminicurvatus halobius]|uniref:Multidrug resistance protein MdtA-like alpha-helical hairpin domain-containing protein n=1 Tax=Sediminicurvatus halobius TaxID=2182432 RepID=A0A2U2N341_9GAMM|nr:efflux RND transporter periplasmic adaptor subunit [Spiribacter halobius]PWG63520.1 hypothetical protein DEM34_08120 [Spiribacter halobius]UEX79608.1 efflux RND transporter periplasmic adaptor subunit [Spiribacter halobius]
MGRGTWHLRHTPAIAVLAVLLGACSADQPEPRVEASTPRPIAWAEARPDDAAPVRVLPGVLRAEQRAPLSFEVAGRVAEVRVAEGDRFAAGATLARLEPESFRLTLRAREGELAEARARLAEAEDDFRRQQRLHEGGHISRAALDTAAAQRDTARGRVDAAEAQVALARDALADTVLRAPYAGEVAQRRVEPAQRVAAGEPVLQIQGRGPLEVALSLPETLVDRLQPASLHEVHLPVRNGVTLSARVREIAADTGDSNAYPVTLALLDPPPGLRAGLTAEVHLRLRAKQADEGVTIPATAFLPGPGETAWAFVYDPGSATVERREIRVASLAGDRARVSAGLAPGEIVAARGVAFLRDGQRVTRLHTGPARYQP